MGTGIDIGRVEKSEIQKLLEDGRWEEYEDAGTGAKASIRIRPLTPKKTRSIQKQCQKWRRGEKVTDEDKQESMFRRWMAAEWKDVLINGEPAECTQANIDTVFDYCDDFAGWIVDTSKQMGRDIEAELKAKKENFTPTSAVPASSSS